MGGKDGGKEGERQGHRRGKDGDKRAQAGEGLESEGRIGSSCCGMSAQIRSRGDVSVLTGLRIPQWRPLF